MYSSYFVRNKNAQLRNPKIKKHVFGSCLGEPPWAIANRLPQVACARWESRTEFNFVETKWVKFQKCRKSTNYTYVPYGCVITHSKWHLSSVQIRACWSRRTSASASMHTSILPIMYLNSTHGKIMKDWHLQAKPQQHAKLRWTLLQIFQVLPSFLPFRHKKQKGAFWKLAIPWRANLELLIASENMLRDETIWKGIEKALRSHIKWSAPDCFLLPWTGGLPRCATGIQRYSKHIQPTRLAMTQ